MALKRSNQRHETDLFVRSPVVDQAIERRPRQRQEEVFGVPLVIPEARPVDKLDHDDEQDEPATPDRDSRSVPDHVRVEARERRAAHPEDAGGFPDWIKSPASARRLGHLVSCMRVSTWSLRRSRRCNCDY